MVSNFDNDPDEVTAAAQGRAVSGRDDQAESGSEARVHVTNANRQTNTQTMRQTVDAEVDGTGNLETAINLRRAITRTARKLRQEAGGELTPTAMATLASIGRSPGVTPTRLAEIEGVRPPTVARVISHLVEAGMIDRVPDPSDGRSWRLDLTAAGVSYLERHRSKKSIYLAQLLDSLPADEVETLSNAASILESALERGPEDRP